METDNGISVIKRKNSHCEVHPNNLDSFKFQSSLNIPLNTEIIHTFCSFSNISSGGTDSLACTTTDLLLTSVSTCSTPLFKDFEF